MDSSIGSAILNDHYKPIICWNPLTLVIQPSCYPNQTRKASRSTGEKKKKKLGLLCRLLESSSFVPLANARAHIGGIRG